MKRKVNEAIEEEEKNATQHPDKCGARLKAKDELQEWLEKQEDLKKNPEKEGSNIFTYRRARGAGPNAQYTD